jgi:hypothetical protein
MGIAVAVVGDAGVGVGGVGAVWVYRSIYTYRKYA